MTETVAYFACGTDGFLTSALNCLERKVTEYTEGDKFSVIAMNPPYGGNELNSIQTNFPKDLRSSETADLFTAIILYRLKYEGGAAVIIPDVFFFCVDDPKLELKNRLLNQFNLHTVIRLPASVFSPYTSIPNNILFFNKGSKSKGVWFYCVNMPDGYKHFSKTKPMLLEHFADCVDWWHNRHNIKDDAPDTFKAKSFTVYELVSCNYDFDLCGYPNDDEKILTPLDTITRFKRRRADFSAKLDSQLDKIAALLEVPKCLPTNDENPFCKRLFKKSLLNNSRLTATTATCSKKIRAEKSKLIKAKKLSPSLYRLLLMTKYLFKSRLIGVGCGSAMFAN